MAALKNDDVIEVFWKTDMYYYTHTKCRSQGLTCSGFMLGKGGIQPRQYI